MSLLDPIEIDRLILDSARQANVLPLTSQCDSHCVFCSHKNNPPGIAVASVGRRSLDEIKRTIAFLDPSRVITVGESATPIIEGEPLTHPDFAEIVRLVRRAFPDTPLEITTNGRYLTSELVDLLDETGGVTLNISLNSSSSRGRRILMGDTPAQSQRAITGVELVGLSSLRFSGSLVAMPNLVGWDDLRHTVRFLAANGAEVVRVIVPAYSDQADRTLFPDATRIFAQVRAFVAELSAASSCPVLIEPSCVTDLTPVVSGVLDGSPACRAGLCVGDVFVEINGKRPASRVGAWKLLLPRGPVLARIRRSDALADVSWVSESEGGSGVTMEYDFDPDRTEKLRSVIPGRPGKSVLLTSELGHGVVCAVLGLLGIDEDVAEAVAAKNLTFGGTIRASGLLTVDDYLAALTSWRRAHPEAVAQILVPVESFSSTGHDLKRRHFSALAEMAGLPVVLA